MTRIFCLCNEHHRPLFEGFFLPSFRIFNGEDFKVETFGLPESDGNMRFGTGRFKAMTTEKAKAVLRLIQRESEPFIVSDVDIQFFGRINGEVSKALAAGKDVTFQKESDVHGVNTGFMLIRPGARTAAFWGAVVAKIASDPNEQINDQHMTNRLLGRGMISHGLFGPRIWAYSQGNPPRDMILHHANCTVDMEAKVRQFGRIRRLMGFNPA